jgi:radical SAM protein with 4Fe4S-binding SPASM domain
MAIAGIRPCTGAGLRSGVRVTLTRANADGLEALLDRAVAPGVDRFCLGSVPGTPFEELWRNPENAVLAAFRRKEERIGGACGACPDRVVCGGCRMRAYRATGDLYSADPFCTAQRGAG